MLRKRKSKQAKPEATETSDQTKVSARIDHAFASSAESAPGPKASWRSKAVYQIKRRKKMELIGVVILLVAVGAYFVFWSDPATEPTASGCSRELVNQSRSALSSSEVDRLQPIVQQMEASEGYEDDPSCVYVVLTYYINVSDSEKATELYNQLVQVYDPEEGYDQSIASRAQSPEEVKPTVEFLQGTEDDFHGSFGGLADEEE